MHLEQSLGEELESGVTTIGIGMQIWRVCAE